MIMRDLQKKALLALEQYPVVALLGPHQVGKTTLAKSIAKSCPSIYLNLKSIKDRGLLSDSSIGSFVRNNKDKLIILDDIKRMPNLVQKLSNTIKKERISKKEKLKEGFKKGRLLILGSSSPLSLNLTNDLLECKIEYLNPLNILEIASRGNLLDERQLWLKGGFPESLLILSEEESLNNRLTLIETYLEREIPLFRSRIPPDQRERLWIMLAERQGSLLHISDLARRLDVSTTTISNYVRILEELFLIRLLPSFHSKTRKRLVKAPRVYFRDTGLLHALLGIRTFEDLLAKRSMTLQSFQGFVIENLLSVSPTHTKARFYETPKGAMVDLILEFDKEMSQKTLKETWAIKIHYGKDLVLKKGFEMALKDIKPTRTFIVHNGYENYESTPHIEIITLKNLMQKILQEIAINGFKKDRPRD